MIEPASTVQAPANPSHTRAVLASQSSDSVVLSVPGTSYQLHLGVYQPLSAHIGKTVIGAIRAQARRIDVVRTGGKYIEPVYGRPRRIQGTIVAIDPADQTVTIDATVPFVCRTDGRQRAEQFTVGQFVACDVAPGASFVPASSA